jgi:serine phosphatase RsbU (regulator of sigma subunit)
MGDLLITILAFFIWMYANLNQIPSGAVEGYRLMEDQYIGMNEGIESANDLIFESIDSLAGELDASVTRSIRDLKALGEQSAGAIDSIKDGFYRQLLGELYRAGENHRRMSTFHLANYDVPAEYYLVGGNGERIREIIDTFREGAEEIAGRSHLSSGSIGLGLETDEIVYRSGYRQPWVSYLFEDVPAGSVIISISYLKQMILLTESAVLNGLIAQVDLSGEARLLQEMAARESEKAIERKEHEIARVKQEQALQEARLEQSLMETKQNRMMAIFAFGGVALVLVLFSISTRAYLRKQKDNRLLAEQKRQISEKNEALNQQNEEISAQRDEIEAQRDMVTRQKEMIEASHEEISASIDYATRLQTSILPNMSLLEEAFSDHFVFFRPKQKVSGDFYWWTRVEERVLVTAADCTGHGVPGAFMSMLGVSLLREIVNREYITHPGVVLNRLRKEVIRSLDQKGEHGEQKDGMDLALISVQPGTLLCEYAGANNSLYLVRNGELTEYKADRMPISHYPRLERFANQEIQLQKGDQLYLFSDGYADQFGGEKRKKFKYKNFARLLVEITSRSMKEQHDILLKTIVAWQGEIEQIDDMVIVGIKI